MSRCISRHGEYSAHELNEDNRCDWCRVWQCPDCNVDEPYPLDAEDHDHGDDPKPWFYQDGERWAEPSPTDEEHPKWEPREGFANFGTPAPTPRGTGS